MERRVDAAGAALRTNRMALLASVSANLAAGWTYDAKHYQGMKHRWHGRVPVRWWGCFPALAARARGQEEAVRVTDPV